MFEVDDCRDVSTDAGRGGVPDTETEKQKRKDTYTYWHEPENGF